MNRALKRITAFALVIVLLLSGFPSPVITLAATQDMTLSVVFNTLSNKYDISFSASSAPAYTDVRFHNPDGTVTTLTGKEVYLNNKVTISTEFLPDHIYDITVDSYRNASDSEPAYEGKVYYLANMTFTGESFNEMAKMSDIEDKAPLLDPNSPGSAVTVRSGDDPAIKLKWKIPTFYSITLGRIVPLTINNNAALNELTDPLVPISKACFQISMTVGHGSTRNLNFNTDYSGSNMVIADENVTVNGIMNGNVTTGDGFVSVTLKKEQGIEPGTEYEFTNIGVIFENSASEQVPVRRTKLRTDSDNRFMVKNIDNAFSDVGTSLTSIFTPMQMELTKVDTDKVQVKFKKITNGVYPELYYQVQYASRIDDLYTQTNRWVKIPNSSLPTTEDYGSEIVTITLNGTQHPEEYFRVVYFDSSS
ncbi:MAG: hypothetical protein N2376_08510, partial [Clostridia bacterium]|nr:hypothetical protein [Clostridia bacterium]